MSDNAVYAILVIALTAYFSVNAISDAWARRAEAKRPFTAAQDRGEVPVGDEARD